MATQLTLNDGSLNSAGALKIKTNGTTEAVDISTGQVVTLAKDAVVNGLTVGRGAGAVSTNTAVGASALAGSNTGAANTAIGASALIANTSGANSTAVGNQAGYSNTTGEITAIGEEALKANTTGAYNTAVGVVALLGNTTGASNTAVGRDSLRNNTTASNNTAVGYQAGYSNSTGTGNTYLGLAAGYSATGDNNTFVGAGAGYFTTGSANTFIGRGPSGNGGGAITTGSKNTIIGAYTGNQGGLDIRTASNYIVLSDGDGNPRMWANGAGWYMPSGGSLWLNNAGAGVSGGGVNIRQSSNTGRIDQYNDGASGLGCQYFYFGGVEKGSITISSTATAYNTSSDYRLKENIAPMTGALARVVQLKPVTYKWKADGSDGEGFIAHELAEVVPQCVSGEKDAVDADNKPVYQGIDTSFLVATLTAAIQELKAEFDAYKEAHP